METLRQHAPPEEADAGAEREPEAEEPSSGGDEQMEAMIRSVRQPTETDWQLWDLLVERQAILDALREGTRYYPPRVAYITNAMLLEALCLVLEALCPTEIRSTHGLSFGNI